MLIHGKKDEIVPCEHSEILFEIAVSAEYKKLITPEGMTHNDFNSRKEFLEPIRKFIEVQIEGKGLKMFDIIRWNRFHKYRMN